MTSEAFWDRHAPKYAAKPIADPGAYEAKLARVRSLLKLTDRVLEIGCGTGGTALTLAPCVAHITATDVSAEMIRIAQSKAAARPSGNVVFEKAAATDAGPGGPFDTILAFSLLHLVDDLRATLDRVHAQLVPGGLFISKTVCLKDRPIAIRAMVGALTRLGAAPRVSRLSQCDLIDSLSRAGFDIEHSTCFGNNRTSPFLVARRR